MLYKTICITGGTGFVGKEIVHQFLKAGYTVRALIRNEASANKLSFIRKPDRQGLQIVYGNARDPNDVAMALQGCTALIHLVGIRRREIKLTGLGYEDVDLGSAIAAAEAMHMQHVKRILFLSAAAIGQSRYVQVKAKAEAAILNADLDWTIFRPSFIVGAGQRWPILIGPILRFLAVFPGKTGDIARRSGNVSKKNLALAFVTALRDDNTIGRVMNVEDIRNIP